MAKTFAQTHADYGTISSDSSAANITLGKSFINTCIHKVIAMRDWNFNRATDDKDSVADQQGYDLRQDVNKMDYLYVYTGSIWYAPIEVKTDQEWRILNRTVITSDIPQFWFQNNETRQVEIFPVPASAGNTIRMGFTKRLADLSVADYTTGTVTTVADDATITGSGTTWLDNMVGMYFSVNGTNTQLDNIWMKVESFTSTTSLELQQSPNAAVSGASYTIAQMIPFPDGFEDIPLNYALWQYYKKRRRRADAGDYKKDYEDGVADMLSRDLRTANDLMVKQYPIYQSDPNRNPYSMEIS